MLQPDDVDRLYFTSHAHVTVDRVTVACQSFDSLLTSVYRPDYGVTSRTYDRKERKLLRFEVQLKS